VIFNVTKFLPGLHTKTSAFTIFIEYLIYDLCGIKLND